MTWAGLTPAGDDELLVRSCSLNNHLHDLWAYQLEHHPTNAVAVCQTGPGTICDHVR